MKRIVIGDPHGRWGYVKQIYDIIGELKVEKQKVKKFDNYDNYRNYSHTNQ